MKKDLTGLVNLCNSHGATLKNYLKIAGDTSITVEKGIMNLLIDFSLRRTADSAQSNGKVYYWTRLPVILTPKVAPVIIEHFDLHLGREKGIAVYNRLMREVFGVNEDMYYHNGNRSYCARLDSDEKGNFLKVGVDLDINKIYVTKALLDSIFSNADHLEKKCIEVYPPLMHEIVKEINLMPHNELLQRANIEFKLD